MIAGPQTIHLTLAQVLQCRDFCLRVAGKIEGIEFGNANTAPRSLQERIRDHWIGKVAELAMSLFLHQHFNIIAPVDFTLYEAGFGDGGDLLLLGQPLDLKATKSGQWLLIENSRFRKQAAQGKLPLAYILAQTEWDHLADEPTGEVVLKGYAYCHELIDVGQIKWPYDQWSAPTAGTQNFLAGTFLPGTLTPVMAYNVGRRSGLLNTNWTGLVERAWSLDQSAPMPAGLFEF